MRLRLRYFLEVAAERNREIADQESGALGPSLNESKCLGAKRLEIWKLLTMAALSNQDIAAGHPQCSSYHSDSTAGKQSMRTASPRKVNRPHPTAQTHPGVCPTTQGLTEGEQRHVPLNEWRPQSSHRLPR